MVMMRSGRIPGELLLLRTNRMECRRSRVLLIVASPVPVPHQQEAEGGASGMAQEMKALATKLMTSV